MLTTKTANVVALLREADRLTAEAASLIADGAHDTDLPLEFTLRLDARNTRWASSELATISEHLRHMPHLRASVVSGIVSWSQCRAIVRAMRDLRVSSHEQVDELIASRAQSLATAEPDRLVLEIEDLCARLRVDLLERREQRAIDRSFLLLRPNLFGGGSLYAEADAERFASIVGALDNQAGAPSEDVCRPEQLMDALVGVCESSLSGSHKTRPQPRLIALLEPDGAKVLWNLPGKAPRLTPLSAEVMACDSEIIPVLMEGSEPVAVGHARKTVSPRLRAAVVARDQGCRFPGCSAPVAYTDAHHIRPRADGGTNEIHNLILLCRRCHRRVHKQGWIIQRQPDGAFGFRLRGRLYLSPPAVRAPARLFGVRASAAMGPRATPRRYFPRPVNRDPSSPVEGA